MMFFLKCLSDEDEIDDLIRREIEARSWFILCDSANARNSLWVQQEIEMIKGYPDKTYCEVTVDDTGVNLEQAISQLIRRASVFKPLRINHALNGLMHGPKWLKYASLMREQISLDALIIPPMTSPCPPRYLVAEWSTISAPRDTGFCR